MSKYIVSEIINTTTGTYVSYLVSATNTHDKACINEALHVLNFCHKNSAVITILLL